MAEGSYFLMGGILLIVIQAGMTFWSIFHKCLQFSSTHSSILVFWSVQIQHGEQQLSIRRRLLLIIFLLLKILCFCYDLIHTLSLTIQMIYPLTPPKYDGKYEHSFGIGNEKERGGRRTL